ncbi:hypothetical protein ACFYO2_06890 [Streptomyces sp. NPDC006602]
MRVRGGQRALRQLVGDAKSALRDRAQAVVLADETGLVRPGRLPGR